MIASAAGKMSEKMTLVPDGSGLSRAVMLVTGTRSGCLEEMIF